MGCNLPPTGTHSVSLKILSMSNIGFSCGVALDSTPLEGQIHDTCDNSWMVCFECGGKFFGGSSGQASQELIDMNQFGGRLKRGDVVAVEVNMDTLQLQFSINGKAAGRQVPFDLKPEFRTRPPG